MGRADQTAKVRGMFIHPEQIAKVIASQPRIAKARLVVDWVDEKDQMNLKCELHDAQDGGNKDLALAVADSLREHCKLRGEVELLPPRSLANDGIVIEDVRDYS